MQSSVAGFIVLDFDGTVAHFGPGGSRGWFSIFRCRGVSEMLLEETYRVVREKGFSVENFLQEIQKKTKQKLDPIEVREEFEQWLAGSLVLYPDVLGAIQEWQEAGIPVVVVSSGEPRYQMQKIQAVHVPYDEVLLIRRSFEKTEAFKKLIATYGEPAILIDDRPDILDKARRVLRNLHVITVWIQRQGSEYTNHKAEFSHIKIQSLDTPQVQRIILEKKNA